MPTYVVTAPDGREYEVTAPEGATQEEVLNYARQNYKASTSAAPEQTVTKTNQPKQPPTKEPSIMDQMFGGTGSMAYSVARGAVINPLAAVNQGLRAITPEGWIPKFDADIESAQYEAGRTELGREGFDVPQLVGGVLSPVNKILPVGGATAVQKIGSMAAAGAVSGALDPVKEAEDFVSQKITQVLAGAAVGGALMTAGQATKLVTNIVKDLPITQAAKERILRKHVLELTGSNQPEVVSKLRNATEIVPGSKPTVAEALSGTPSGAKLIAEQSRVVSQAPEKFLGRLQEQQQARSDLMHRTFGDADTITQMKNVRAERTLPFKERALAYADVYGNYAPQLEKAIQETETLMVKVKPSTTFGARYGRSPEAYDLLAKNKTFKEMQLKSLSESGFFPLSSGSLITRLDQESSKVGQRSNDLLVDGANVLKQKLARLTDENGIIKSDDLYNVRKNIGEDLRTLLQSKGNQSFSTDAMAVEKQLRGLIDESITKASGTNDWMKYIKNYSTYSTKIDRLRVGQELAEKLGGNITDKERVGVFASAIRDFDTLSNRVLKTQRYERPEDLFTTRQNTALNKVYADLQRKAKSEDILALTGKGRGVDFEGTKEVPPMLDQRVTIVKSIISTMKRGSQKEFDQKIADLMLDPAKLAGFIETVPKSQIGAVAEAMMTKAGPETQKLLKQALYFTPGQATNQLTE